MGRFLGVLLATVSLTAPASGASPRHTQLDIFVYDTSIPEMLAGATVTVAFDGGVAVGETRGRQGRVRFRLPDVYDSVLVTTEAPGFCPDIRELVLNGRSLVGGHGVFIGLAPCFNRP